MIKLLLLTSRPIFWLTHFSSFIFGISQLSISNLEWNKFILAIALLSFPFSLFIYGLNDISDYDSDLLNNRKGGILGLKHRKADLSTILSVSIASGIVFLVFSYFFGINTFIIAIIMLAVLGFYSIKPLRFKNIPVIDAIAGGGLYSLLIALWGYSIFSEGIFLKSTDLNPFIFMFSVGFTLQSMGSIIDYESDLTSNEVTSSTFFGRKVTSIYTGILNIVASLMIKNNRIMQIVILLFAIFSFSFLNNKIQESKFIKKYFSVFGIIFSFIITVIFYLFFPEALR